MIYHEYYMQFMPSTIFKKGIFQRMLLDPHILDNLFVAITPVTYVYYFLTNNS